ncbi:penicillin-binding protein activator [Catenovulum sp. 2E275]|uniref:penicillin-binding protein activator n=1 Tax=Catenovulum sp. 2E275 TaxID=2980497 RepID=UPI0021CE18B8|nr:penicillin-binding protein activator [Catenovulum sp. 2E275]MCU4676666.1 penicillin-binding protein activator [Catenovulum sp. 2E275]
MIKRTKFYQISLLLSCFYLLTSCGSAPNKPAVNVSKPEKTEQPSIPKTQTVPASDFLDKANQADSLEQSIIWYVRAADAYLQQQEPKKAYAILSQLQPELISAAIKPQYHLFFAETYLSFEQYPSAYQQLEQIDNVQGFEARFLSAKSIAASQTRHYLIAAKNRIELKSYLTDEAQIQAQNNLLWQDLINLHPSAYKNFQQPSQIELSGWLELLQITQANADSPANMLLKIKNWQAQFASHPAAKQLPDGLQQALKTKPYKPEHIAVILPLSGRFIKQGQAIQQGISASFFEQKLSHSPKVTFIDSETINWDEFALAEYDFIIGPLLKENIQKLISLKLNKPILFLNDISDLSGEELVVTDKSAAQQLAQTSADTPVESNEPVLDAASNILTQDEPEQVAAQYSFTLSPEMEARQAAIKMHQLGHQKPIVFAANNSFGKRMSDAFVKAFSEFSNKHISVAFYSNTKEMETSVTSLMETEQSESRIKTIRSLVGRGVQFESEPRNRRDIDAIYIIGDPTQTRILKPYIDVNTSPFAPIIPIYASSLSYSSNLNNADMRDLNQIIFSDMPWILPGRANHNQLAHQMQLAWKNTNDQLSRLFAFGFDAYQLVPHLAQMQVFPNYRIAGLSGELSLQDSLQIERAMSWAKYDHGRVTNLALKNVTQ